MELVELDTGVDLFDAVVATATGRPPPVDRTRVRVPRSSAVVTNVPATSADSSETDLPGASEMVPAG